MRHNTAPAPKPVLVPRSPRPVHTRTPREALRWELDRRKGEKVGQYNPRGDAEDDIAASQTANVLDALSKSNKYLAHLPGFPRYLVFRKHDDGDITVYTSDVHGVRKGVEVVVPPGQVQDVYHYALHHGTLEGWRSGSRGAGLGDVEVDVRNPVHAVVDWRKWNALWPEGRLWQFYSEAAAREFASTNQRGPWYVVRIQGPVGTSDWFGAARLGDYQVLTGRSGNPTRVGGTGFLAHRLVMFPHLDESSGVSSGEAVTVTGGWPVTVLRRGLGRGVSKRVLVTADWYGKRLYGWTGKESITDTDPCAQNPAASIVRGRGFIHEFYESASREAQDRAKVLRTLGYSVAVVHIGGRIVTPAGHVQTDVVEIRPGASGDDRLEHVPPAAISNPSASPEQYRLAQAVLSGTARQPGMPVSVAREIVERTPARLRSEYSRYAANPISMANVKRLLRHSDATLSKMLDQKRLGIERAFQSGSTSVLDRLQREEREIIEARASKLERKGNPSDSAAAMYATNPVFSPGQLAQVQSYIRSLKSEQKHQYARELSEWMMNLSSYRPPIPFYMPVHDATKIRQKLEKILGVSAIKKNPEDGASTMYETFHGVPSTETLEIREEVHYHGNLAALGDLVCLKVTTPSGTKAVIDFGPEDRPILSSNEDGTQLYIRGGDQELDLSALGITGAEAERDSVVVGDLTDAEYETRKKFDRMKKIIYFHKLGEESGGPLPVLVYDAPNRMLSISGGTYRVEEVGIAD